jgi:hypothetical protein
VKALPDCRSAVTLGLAVLGLVACQPRERAVVQISVEEPAWHVGEMHRAWRPHPLADTVGLHGIGDLKIDHGTFWIADAADRIVQFSLDLVPLAAIPLPRPARRESGTPQPQLQPWAEGFVWTQPGSHTASYAGRDGWVHWTVPLPADRGAGVGTLADGSVLVPVRSETHYLELVLADGTRRAWGERAADPEGSAPRSAAGEDASHATNDLLVVAPGDTVFLLDGVNAELLRFAPDGRLLWQRALPAGVMGTLQAESGDRRATRARQGESGAAAAFVDFERSSDGRLLLLARRRPEAGSPLGLVVEPNGDRAHLLVADREVTGWDQRDEIVAAALDGETLVIATAGGELAVFGLVR